MSEGRSAVWPQCDHCGHNVMVVFGTKRLIHTETSIRICPDTDRTDPSYAAYNGQNRFSADELAAEFQEAQIPRLAKPAPKEEVALDPSEEREVSPDPVPADDAPVVEYDVAPVVDHPTNGSLPAKSAFTPLDGSPPPPRVPVPAVRMEAIRWCLDNPGRWVAYEPSIEDDPVETKNMTGTIRRGERGFTKGFEALFRNKILYFRYTGETE